MSFLQRIRNLYFWSSISKEDIKANPGSYHIKQINKDEIKGQAYIVGTSEEEAAFRDSLNFDGRDTKLN